MNFVQELPELNFGDRHEVAFERVTVDDRIESFTVNIDNLNSSIDNVFRIEESEFPGVEDITSSDIQNNYFRLKVINEQPEMQGDTEKCNFDYKGDIIIKNNVFGFLRADVRLHFRQYSVKIRSKFGQNQPILCL